MSEPLRAAIFDALNNADEGGYSDFVRHNSVMLVALDLYDCDDEIAALLESSDEKGIGDVLGPLIGEWREGKKS